MKILRPVFGDNINKTEKNVEINLGLEKKVIFCYCVLKDKKVRVLFLDAERYAFIRNKYLTVIKNSEPDFEKILK
jgi:hypothetical protein